MQITTNLINVLHDGVNNKYSTMTGTPDTRTQRAFLMGMYIAFCIIQSFVYGDPEIAIGKIESYIGKDVADHVRKWEVQSD